MEHKKALQMIRDIFMYMDRTYIPSHEICLNSWTNNIICYIETRLQVTLFEIVQKERNGEVINRGLMRDIIKIFYRGESQQLIECCDCLEYLKKTEKCLDEEIDRVAQYLDAKSEVKIIDLVEKEMIESQMNCIVSGLVNMITEDKYNDLAWIYNFFRRLPNGLKMIQDVMTSHIRVTGKQLVINPEQVKDPLEFVQRLSEEKHKHDKIISLAFNND
ncbi:putative cullin [Helianthus annuus]|uniref:Cullin n=2 Tax=Helianthus annuus TaxID=4232 RepID=A0A9K3EAL5_HELAN|nr:putative cullin [Helianthus annuus]KAJ0485697.1 putative cullin [Helianthus annuus]KAJ0656251.1 putative cullin [Helianthus annuus]KAJ0840319.1 putative cullin [Helianthus annuus]